MPNFKIRFRVYDLLFYFLLVFSFYFTRNMLCRLMMVLFFGYTVWRLIATKSKPCFSFYYVGFFIFIIYGFINVAAGNVINTDIATTMGGSLFLSLLMIFAIVQYIYMTDDIPRVLRITELGIFSTALAVTLLSLGTITQGRLGVGTEINSNVLAILSVCGAILTMYLYKIEKLGRVANWFRLVFYVLVILLTGSRKGLIMIPVAVVVIQVMDGKNIFKLLRNALIGALVMVVLYHLIMNVEVLYKITGVRLQNLLEYLAEGSTTEASLSDRDLLPKLGMEYFKQNPWTGYGFDCFKLVSGKSSNGRVPIGQVGFYSHNNYVELLFGGGIIGFVLYYIPIIYLMIKLLKSLPNAKHMPYLLAIMVSRLMVEYAYVSYYERLDIYINAIVLGCVLICPKKQSAHQSWDKEREGCFNYENDYNKDQTNFFEHLAEKNR